MDSLDAFLGLREPEGNILVAAWVSRERKKGSEREGNIIEQMRGKREEGRFLLGKRKELSGLTSLELGGESLIIGPEETDILKKGRVRQ